MVGIIGLEIDFVQPERAAFKWNQLLKTDLPAPAVMPAVTEKTKLAPTITTTRRKSTAKDSAKPNEAKADVKKPDSKETKSKSQAPETDAKPKSQPKKRTPAKTKQEGQGGKTDKLDKVAEKAPAKQTEKPVATTTTTTRKKTSTAADTAKSEAPTAELKVEKLASMPDIKEL